MIRCNSDTPVTEQNETPAARAFLIHFFVTVVIYRYLSMTFEKAIIINKTEGEVSHIYPVLFLQ